MSNYIDLEPQVSDYYGTSPGQERRAGICDALRFLDSHPEHVPGRTITQSEFRDAYSAFGDMDGPDCYGSLLDLLGITVTPDPKPTNAEKLEIKLRAFALEVSASEHQLELARSSAPELAAWLDEHGVKAPGGDDE